jgi:hypothetical protein
MIEQPITNMKKLFQLMPLLSATSVMAGSSDAPKLEVSSDDTSPNHIAFSWRPWLNVDAKFLPQKRYTPDGDQYNFIDGYVLQNSVGDINPNDPSRPVTGYYGYDSYSGQVHVQSRNLSLARADSDIFTRPMNDDGLKSCEVTYSRDLGKIGKLRYGFDLAANYMNLALRDYSNVSGPGTVYNYQFAASPQTYGQAGDFQGRYIFTVSGNPNPNIYDTLISSSPTTIQVLNRNRLDADLWGFRLGPNLQCPLGSKIDVSLVGGLAVEIVNAGASWFQQVTVTAEGVTHQPDFGSINRSCEVMWGYYVGANATWHIDQDLDFIAGLQFQDVGTYTRNIPNQNGLATSVQSRQMELNLSESLFLSLGFSFKF